MDFDITIDSCHNQQPNNKSGFVCCSATLIYCGQPHLDGPNKILYFYPSLHNLATFYKTNLKIREDAKKWQKWPRPTTTNFFQWLKLINFSSFARQWKLKYITFKPFCITSPIMSLNLLSYIVIKATIHWN